MSNLYLITHPEVIINPKQPIDEWVLSDEGISRAKNLMTNELWHNVSAIYSSTEPKALSVGKMAAQNFNIPLIEHAELVEIDRSATGFLPYNDFMNNVKDFFDQPDENCRGWESARSATKRVSIAVEEIMAKHPSENVALVGHGAIFALLLSYIKDIEPSFSLCQKDVGYIAKIDWKNKKVISGWEKY